MSEEEYKYRKEDRCHGGRSDSGDKGTVWRTGMETAAERAQKRAAEIETVTVTKMEATV